MDNQKTENEVYRIPIRYVPQIDHEYADLIFEFFLVYSRFEFALKQTGFRRKVWGDSVEPDWRAFSTKVCDRFDIDKSPELRQAFNYYRTYPPMIQVIADNQLSWKQNIIRKTENEFAWVLRSVGIVRNNLFHGGKFPWNPVRDARLLSHGLTILYECLELDGEVFRAFNHS